MKEQPPLRPLIKPNLFQKPVLIVSAMLCTRKLKWNWRDLNGPLRTPASEKARESAAITETSTTDRGERPERDLERGCGLAFNRTSIVAMSPAGA
jgi:hypothetical protein